MEDLKITLVLGLPGSGKTTFSKKLQIKTPFSLLLDDYSLNYANGIDIPSDKNILIITDPLFLSFSYEIITTYFIKKYLKYHVYFSWIIFKLDTTSCLKNIRERNDGRIISNYFMNNLYQKSKKNIDKYINSIMLHNEFLEIREPFKLN